MNPQIDYIEKQKVACREWFKEHTATVIGNTSLTPLMGTAATILNWQKPASWNYGCRFIIHRRWLCIVGDIGEAVFGWGQDLTLEFLGGLDFGYFLSKCQASRSGGKFEQWHGDVAWLEAQAHVAELKAMPEDDRPSDYDAELERISELDKDSAREDYESAARDVWQSTGESEQAAAIHTCGMAPSVHAIGMFVGLQMAIAQLKEGK